MKTLLSHVEFNVSDYKKSVQFYDLILPSLGWKKVHETAIFTAYTDGALKLILCPVVQAFADQGYHRKRVGLNHLALAVDSKKAVDDFFQQIAVPHKLKLIYTKKPEGDDDYFALYFEDPDGIKLEVVYAPRYCL